MTDLRACYFCGTAEAVETGPAVPPSLDPPPAARRSVALCPSCREKLTAVVAPLVEDSGDPDPDWSFQASAGRTDEERIDTADEVDDGATDATDGTDGETTAATDEDGASAELPDQYHAVLRFLNNREFPVAREEIQTVVAGAYDLSEREVGAVIDTAVERGVLVEVEGRLARSRDRL